MTSKLSRVSLAASNLSDPAESAVPRQARLVQILARTGTLKDFQPQPASVA